MNKPKRIGTIKQTAETYPAFTQGSLRWLVFNERANGFCSCVRRIGGKIIIDFDAFESWIDSQATEAVSAKSVAQ